MKEVLITGITGFAGSHLAEHLLATNKYKVSGIHSSARNLRNIESIKDHVSLFKVDLTDKEKTAEVILQQKPSIIFHLAAAASVKDSFENATEYITNNATSQITIFEALRKNNMLDTKVMVVSSANIYGLVQAEDLPIDENVTFRPDNPYAVSKITQDYLGLCYFLSYKMPIIRLRPFNHIGPRLSPDISLSRFAKLIAEIEKGNSEPVLTVGNLSAKRDFTDVRDMVRAYTLAAEKGTSGEAYNIGSGKSYSIKEMLARLISLSHADIVVKEDQSLFRPSDIPDLRADVSKFKEASGWTPEISIDKMLQDLLDYWRGIV